MNKYRKVRPMVEVGYRLSFVLLIIFATWMFFLVKTENSGFTQQKAYQKIFIEPVKYQEMILEVSAYAPDKNVSGMCADGTPETTSTGEKPGPGTIAVNPAVIPYGSMVYVEGYGWGIAEDTGAMIRKRTDAIEVYMTNYNDAIEWGRRKNVTVFVEVK